MVESMIEIMDEATNETHLGLSERIEWSTKETNELFDAKGIFEKNSTFEGEMGL